MASHGARDGNSKVSEDKPEEVGGCWYFSRKEIEEESPSRKDGIDLKKETYLRKSYCTFLQDLGMRLKVPQVTIATAIIFCHRFFLRQSHAKNDRRAIATVCMFLAGKVEETPRPLKDVILVSYEIIHKKDPAAVQRIKQKEVYEKQKELIVLGERVVLGTLGFDLNVHHPYKPLVEAIKKFKVAQNKLAQVAWNFVNDGLRTSLCLQFKPHHIAAGAIFLAAKFLKVKLPSEGEKVWWQEFDITPRQLEEVSNQMLELYEQNRVPQSQGSEAEGSAGDSKRPPSKPPANDEHGGATSKVSSLKPAPSRPGPSVQHTDNHGDECGGLRADDEIHERDVTPQKGNSPANQDKAKHGNADHQESDGLEPKDKSNGRNMSNKDATVAQDGNQKLDVGKLKVALERRKAQGDITRKPDPLDELERELEAVEVPSESDMNTHERRQSSPKHEAGDSQSPAMKGQSSDFGTAEEGEVEVDRGYQSPSSMNMERNGLGRHGYSEIDQKQHVPEEPGMVSK